MANIKTFSSIIRLDEEIDRLTFLCARITQIASNIRSVHLSTVNLSVENTQSRLDSLLSMAEHIEGSTILLESLLAMEQQNYMLTEYKKLTRIHYTRNHLLQLRRRVTSTLSKEIKNLLKQVVERESNDSVEIERKSWRDIRTILI
ncbi:unnamed protein product [Rotaria socialis]|uniref:Uncharacterized protein n=1 Tax=Rotaria socialis TaxID=392032 RepID=A0A821BR94_9BILA|nr:unnamed protein product [Rotaria socialis]CAF3422053.1 unnamed protein product [Rotaria socialis]CAF3450497.1 unnamed protein product [Rotaria socialis]CAF4117304.1 unnamed protein product [Rotaria socialis]CAF4289852.1 unnamed protein product [Rotaria socialis]